MLGLDQRELLKPSFSFFKESISHSASLSSGLSERSPFPGTTFPWLPPTNVVSATDIGGNNVRRELLLGTCHLTGQPKKWTYYGWKYDLHEFVFFLSFRLFFDCRILIVQSISFGSWCIIYENKCDLWLFENLESLSFMYDIRNITRFSLKIVA